jgi:hypothetical protein
MCYQLQVPLDVVKHVSANIAAPTAGLFDQVQWSILVRIHTHVYT